MGFLGRGSNPLPTTGGLGSAVSSPSGVRGGAPISQSFSLFSAFRMTSPDTITLLIVDCHAAKTPVPPPCVCLCTCNPSQGRPQTTCLYSTLPCAAVVSIFLQLKLKPVVHISDPRSLAMRCPMSIFLHGLASSTVITITVWQSPVA